MIVDAILNSQEGSILEDILAEQVHGSTFVSAQYAGFTYVR